MMLERWWPVSRSPPVGLPLIWSFICVMRFTIVAFYHLESANEVGGVGQLAAGARMSLVIKRQRS